MHDLLTYAYRLTPLCNALLVCTYELDMSTPFTFARRASAATAVPGQRRLGALPCASRQRRGFRVCASASKMDQSEAKFSGRRVAIGSLIASMASIGLAPGAEAVSTLDTREELETIEAELNSSFAVDLGGFAVDHKSLIYGVFFGQWVALVGAAVGGLTAKQRSEEVAELNAKLSETNKMMRKQMSRGSEFIGDTIDEGTDEAEIVEVLRKGKRALKEKNSETAHAAFSDAMAKINMLSDTLDSPWMLERKARRGLSAAEIQMKDYQSAEENLRLVVKICEENLEDGHERPELADAYGCLADMYTEWGQLDKAAEIYDKMITEMGS